MSSATVFSIRTVWCGTRTTEGTTMERGATAVEYILLVTLVAMMIVGALLVLGPGVAALFEVDFSPGG